MATMVEWKIKGIFKADAGKVYQEINSIGEEYTPESIVEYAENPFTELHKCFEWDDEIAANKFRLEQARKICRCLVITTQTKKGEIVKVRVISNSGENDSLYRPTVRMVKNDDQYLNLLNQAKAELIQFKKRYSIIRELDSIFEEIDTLIN